MERPLGNVHHRGLRIDSPSRKQFFSSTVIMYGLDFWIPIVSISQKRFNESLISSNTRGLQKRVYAKFVCITLAVVLLSGWPIQDHPNGPNLATGSPGSPFISHLEKCRSIWSCPISKSTTGSAAGSGNLQTLRWGHLLWYLCQSTSLEGFEVIPVDDSQKPSGNILRAWSSEFSLQQ